MAWQLTKKTLGGAVLKRLPQVDAELDELTAVSVGDLLKRIRISTRRSNGYCSTEALIGLFRDAQRRGLTQLANGLIEELMRRCTRVVQKKLHARGVDTPEALDNVVDRFTDLLALEAKTGRCEKLDFFEVLFDNAVTALVASEARRAFARHARFVPIASANEDGPESDAIDALTVGEHCQSSLTGPEQGVFTSELLSAMKTLTDGERVVAILTVLGVQNESVDKSEPTIASHCNIDPRSVRYRQKRVAEKLAKFKE